MKDNDNPVAIVNSTALTMDDLTKVPTKALTRAIDQRWDRLYLWSIKASTTLRLLRDCHGSALGPAALTAIEKALKDDPTA